MSRKSKKNAGKIAGIEVEPTKLCCGSRSRVHKRGCTGVTDHTTRTCSVCENEYIGNTCPNCGAV